MFSDNIVSIPLGITIGLLASFVQSLGLTIQRKSHVQNQALPEHRQRVEHKRPLWLLGFAIFISSNILGSLVQIASLPVVILAPLGAVSLLWNAFFARVLLGDVFSPWMILGTIFIAGGAVLIAFFGIVPEQTRSLEDLLELFRRPTFVVYFSLLGFVVIVCLAITHITEFSLSRRIANAFPPDSASSIDLSPPAVNVNLPTHATNLTTGLTEEINDTTLATERTPLLDRKSGTSTPTSTNGKTPVDPTLVAINRTRLWVAISYASFSGIISGMCLLFAKSGVELLLLTLKGHNQFWRWEAWMLVVGLAAFALLQLWYLHKALILADPILVCPSAFCLYNLSSIVNGLVYFDQFALIPPLHLGLVSLGIVVLLGGVWIVSIQPGSTDAADWNDEGSEYTDEGSPIFAERSEEEDSRAAETVPLTNQSSTKRSSKPRIPIIPMDRETRSESSVPNIMPIGQVFEDQLSESPQPKRPRAETSALYPEIRSPSHKSRRRPTVDARLSSGSSQLVSHGRTSTQPHAHTLTHSHSHSHPHAPHSPPLSTVPMLGAGFQIGLSPVSPGFTILPLDRTGRRRTSGIGIGGPAFADVVNETMGAGGSGGASRRRRTVSEGEVVAEVAARRKRSGGLDEDVEGVGAGGAGDVDGAEADATTRTLHDGELGGGLRRWQWLRRVFTPGSGKDKDKD